MNYSDSERKIIIADSLRELNYKQKRLLLLSEDDGEPEREKYSQLLIKTLGDGVYTKIKEKFRDLKYCDGVLETLQKRNVECITLNGELYPEALKRIEVPPLVLYARGRTELLSQRLFAVVGSRRTTAPVVEECKRISAELSEYVAIVTGVADGADSAAIRGGLRTGNIICVLPGGHDSSGAANFRLLREVEENGLSVSEFPPRTAAQRHTFILRNRIITGMSEGVLVVSAAKKSGALSTAGYAFDYSKDVFAFPYGIGVTSGEGCNNLIKKGAYLCDCAQDILKALNIAYREREDGQELEPDERAIVNALKAEGELHAEKLAALTGKKLTETLTLCSLLEIKGIIVRTGGNTFSVI